MDWELFGGEINVWLDAVIRLVLVVLVMTLVVMGLIYAERKVLARFQQRIGPQRTGPFGLLQSLADALKLLGKEDLRPQRADPWVFELAVYFVFIPVFLAFVVVPFLAGWHVRALELGLLYFLAVTSLGMVGWVMAGWGSDNRYAIVGALRAVAQGISYELPLILSLISVAVFAGTLNLQEIVAQQDVVPFVVWQPLAFALFFIAMQAELYRTPFDIPVGESEIVGGPFVEYSGIRWSMFFLAEYAALWILSLITAAVFLGGWEWPFGSELGLWWQLILMGAKSLAIIFVVFWMRATFPRLRVDQLMQFSWKVLLPLALLQVLLTGLVLVYEWPEVILLIVGLAGVIALARIIDYSVRRPSAGRQPVARPEPEPAT